MKKRVGIEAIAVAIPRRYLALEDLAVARGVAPAKYTIGLGAREMSVADPSEDTVALDITEYERIMGLPRELAISTEAPPGTFLFAGVRDDRRTYVGSGHVP